MIGYEGCIEHLVSCAQDLGAPISSLPKDTVDTLFSELKRRSKLMINFLQLYRNYIRVHLTLSEANSKSERRILFLRRRDLMDDLYQVRERLAEVNIETERIVWLF